MGIGSVGKGIRPVGKASNFPICPICGKPDWCAVFDIEGGYQLLTCMRDTNFTNTQGLDGKFYIYVGTSKAGNATYEEATQRLMRTGKDAEKEKFKKAYEQTARKLEKEEEVKPLPASKLDKIYRALLDKLILEKNHKEYLLKEGWTEDMISKSGVKSFPVPDGIRKRDNIKTKNPKRSQLGKYLYEKFGDLTGVPGAYIRDGKYGRYWTFSGAGGLILPVPNEYGQIHRLRIRLDNPTKKGGKYRNFSSFKEIYVDENGKEIDKSFYMNMEVASKSKIIIKNKYENGTRSGNVLGFYDENCLVPNDYMICYLTEGEKKAFVANYILGYPCINVPGVNSWSKMFDKNEKGVRFIDVLKEKGVKVLIIAYDNDKYKNEAVMKNQNQIIEALREEGLIIGLAEWDSWYENGKEKGKGLDDILLAGKRPRYETVVFNA